MTVLIATAALTSEPWATKTICTRHLTPHGQMSQQKEILIFRIQLVTWLSNPHHSLLCIFRSFRHSYCSTYSIACQRTKLRYVLSSNYITVDLRLWFTRIPNMEPLVKTPDYEQGSYGCFDPHNWETVRKNLSQTRMAGRRMVNSESDPTLNTDHWNMRRPPSSSLVGGLPPVGRQMPSSQTSDQRGGSSTSNTRKEGYNWGYDDDISEEVFRTTSAMENIQLDRKARNLTTSWRHPGNGAE